MFLWRNKPTYLPRYFSKTNCYAISLFFNLLLFNYFNYLKVIFRIVYYLNRCFSKTNYYAILTNYNPSWASIFLKVFK